MVKEIKQGDEFDATDDSLRAIPTVSNTLLELAERYTDEFVAAGLTVRQASSVTAHLLLDAAWGIASFGAIFDGDTPNKAIFRDAVEAAFARLDPDALAETMSKITEDAPTLSAASQAKPLPGERASPDGETTGTPTAEGCCRTDPKYGSRTTPQKSDVSAPSEAEWGGWE